MIFPRVAFLAMLGLGMSFCPALADGSAWADAQILPDPSLANGHVFPPSAATAGVAVVSAAVDGPVKDCSRSNPCAVPTPARDHVAVVLSASVRPVSVPAVSVLKAHPAIAVAPGLRAKATS